MINEDFEIAKKIFSLISEGILPDYDAFSFTAEVHPGYIESELIVTINGVELRNAETDFNRAVLYSLLEEFKSGFKKRGEDWESFTMSYTVGGQVNTKFKYPEL